MKKLSKIRSLLFLWAAISVFFTISYYRLASTGGARTIQKLAVVFWAVQGLIAIGTFFMSFKSKPKDVIRDKT